MFNWLDRHQRTHKTPHSGPELLVATPTWTTARDIVTVIDVEEFEAAHRDPDWVDFCKHADEYLESLQRQLVH